MPNQKFIPREVSPAMASRIARITTDAAQRGDVKSGFIVIEWKGDGETTAQVYLDYAPSWNGKSSHYEYGDWVETE